MEILIVLALVLAAFLCGMFVYRAVVNDALKLQNGEESIDPPQKGRKETAQEGEEQELLDAIASYDGGTIKVKR